MRTLDILQLIATFNFLFIGGLILLSGKKVIYGVRLLGFFLVAKGITLFTNLAWELDWPINQGVLNILGSALFFYAPILYFFARNLVSQKEVRLSVDWPHFLPFGIYLIYNVFNLFVDLYNEATDLTITAAYYIQTLSYTLAGFVLITKKGDGSRTQVWIRNVLAAFLLVWIMFLSQVIAGITGSAETALVFKTMGVVSILILANLTIVIALRSPDFFFKSLRLIKSSDKQNKLITRANYESILHLMSSKELYKNPDFKVADLAREISMSERNTSLIIKRYHGANFHDFLNTYRVNAAKKMFMDYQDQMTIVEVLHSVGFNSKSVFNTAFKKKEGMTPSEYKKSIAQISYSG